MKATEAFEIATKEFNLKLCNNHPYEIIADLIKNNAEKGKYSIGVSGSLLTEVKDRLLLDGYNVEFIYNSMATRISWDKIETK